MLEYEWVRFSDKKPNVGEKVLIFIEIAYIDYEDNPMNEYGDRYREISCKEKIIVFSEYLGNNEFKSFERSKCCGCSPNTYDISQEDENFVLWKYIELPETD